MEINYESQDRNLIGQRGVFFVTEQADVYRDKTIVRFVLAEGKLKDNGHGYNPYLVRSSSFRDGLSPESCGKFGKRLLETGLDLEVEVILRQGSSTISVSNKGGYFNKVALGDQESIRHLNSTIEEADIASHEAQELLTYLLSVAQSVSRSNAVPYAQKLPSHRIRDFYSLCHLTTKAIDRYMADARDRVCGSEFSRRPTYCTEGEMDMLGVVFGRGPRREAFKQRIKAWRTSSNPESRPGN